MLGEPKLKVLLELIKHCSHDELVWMNGYLTGLLARAQEKEETVLSKPLASRRLRNRNRNAKGQPLNLQPRQRMASMQIGES
jgi:hypothetical protein